MLPYHPGTDVDKWAKAELEHRRDVLTGEHALDQAEGRGTWRFFARRLLVAVVGTLIVTAVAFLGIAFLLSLR